MQFLDSQVLDIFGRLALAALLGALIGIERELARKTAGIRTFALVALGSALFTIIPQVAFMDYGVGFDPSRMASQVVVGIGFIGAGMIVFHKTRVKGLTTAAGIWVAAAIGMSVAFRMYSVAIFATLITILILVFLWFIEHGILKRIKPFAADSRDEDSDD